MTTTLVQPFPRLHRLPVSLPIEGAIRIELQEGVPVFRASASVQDRVEKLLRKRRESGLKAEETEEPSIEQFNSDSTAALTLF